MSTVQVGFTPVAAGKGVIAGVAAGAAASMAGGEAGDGASPLGFLDALLDMLTQNLDGPAAPETPPTTTDVQMTAPAVPAPAELGAIATDLAIKNNGKAVPLPAQTAKLLRDLAAALRAIDQSGEGEGEPIDPALEKKLADTADQLAGLLGITLPAPPVVDPAIAAAAAAGSTTPTEAIDGTPATPPTSPVQAEPISPAAPASQSPEDDFALALKNATAALPNTDAADAAAPAPPTLPPAEANEAAPAQPVIPDARLAKLIDKLGSVAMQIETTAPAVSDKLAKLAEALSATVAAGGKTAAELDASLDDADVAALSTPKPEPRPAATASIFTQPVLPTPAVAVAAAAPGKPDSKTAEVTAPPEGATKSKTDEAPAEVRLSPEKASAEKPADKDAKVSDRKEFGQHLAEARAERVADKAQDQQTQNPAAPVRTETGVIAPKTVHAAYQAPVQQVNLPQVAFEVVRQFNQGASRFQIRLDPPEMGRIDVNMKIDTDGNVQARMTVERVETLDLMQRDQRQLERALAQAGLDSSKTTLEFSLRQNPSGRDGQNPQQQQQNQSGGSPFARNNPTGTEDIPDIVSTQYRGSASLSGVNLFV